jgi:hypothetical protein
MREQRVHECAAAVDEEITAGLFLQRGDCVDNLAFEQGRVPLERLRQRRRGDELRQAVHPVGERVA